MHTTAAACAPCSKKKERQQAAEAGAADSPRSRLSEAAAEFSEVQQAWLLSAPSGLGVGAEAAIAQVRCALPAATAS